MRALGVTLAVLLLASAHARSIDEAGPSDVVTEKAQDQSGLLEKVSRIIEALGGLDGALSKIQAAAELIKKAMTDTGLGGTIARGILQVELEQIKQKVIEAQGKVIDKLFDELKRRIGLSNTYASEEYFLAEAARTAIELIRKNIQEILAEIRQAQAEHDEQFGKVSQEVLDKIQDRVDSLRLRIKDLGKQIIDQVLGGRQNYALEGVGHSLEYQLEETYALDEFVVAAIQQVRVRILEYLERIKEAKKIVETSFGDSKDIAKRHLRELEQKLRETYSDLRDTILGRKPVNEMEDEEKVMENYIAENFRRL